MEKAETHSTKKKWSPIFWNKIEFFIGFFKASLAQGCGNNFLTRSQSGTKNDWLVFHSPTPCHILLSFLSDHSALAPNTSSNFATNSFPRSSQKIMKYFWGATVLWHFDLYENPVTLIFLQGQKNNNNEIFQSDSLSLLAADQIANTFPPFFLRYVNLFFFFLAFVSYSWDCIRSDILYYFFFFSKRKKFPFWLFALSSVFRSF